MFTIYLKIYYLCLHERKNTKDIGKDNSHADIYCHYNLFSDCLSIHLALESYPKNLSQINLTGKINAACRYLFRVCGSLYIRYTNLRFILSTHAG